MSLIIYTWGLYLLLSNLDRRKESLTLEPRISRAAVGSLLCANLTISSEGSGTVRFISLGSDPFYGYFVD